MLEPKCIVLSESFAKKIFGNENALNKVVQLNDVNFKITAIIEDLPFNTHFQFNALGSFSTVDTENNSIVKQDGFSFYTYLLCNKNINTNLLEEKINRIATPITDAMFGAYGMKSEFTLDPLSNIHLYSKSKYGDFKKGGDINKVYIFIILAIFIILIGVINFINLMTANSDRRSKEIGLRKVMGANKRNLFNQFISESILISFIAFIIALFISELLIGSFRYLMDSPFSLLYKKSPLLLFILITSIAFIGLISGIYPSLYLSKFSSIKVLKGRKASGKKNTLLQKTLVVFQFTVTIFILTNLALLYKQLLYMKNKDLGFNKNQILVVDNFTEKIQNSYSSLKAELLNNPDILSVTASRSVPGLKNSIQTCRLKGEDPNSAIHIEENRIKFDYLKTYGMNIIEGRDFSESFHNETESFIINETAAKVLGITKNAIGTKIFINHHEGNVIGVVKDFHFKSLHEEISPFVFTMYNLYKLDFSKISIKLNTDNIQQTLKSIEQIFLNVDPNNTFEYSFLDQQLRSNYKSDENTNILITYGSILAIVISILGLIGLSLFSIQQKIREIGIRKVFGASVLGLIKKFVFNKIKWVLLAAILAFPIAYYAMEIWIQRFVYQTQISIWMFAFGGLLVLVIATLTVSLVSLKAAQSNPVDILKYE